MRVVPGLHDRIGHTLRNALGQDLPGLLARRADRLQPPVFDFENQQPAPRMQNDEIRMSVFRADGHVVPDQVVIVELLLQALGRSALALRHAGDAGAQGGDDGGHRFVPGSVCISPSCLNWWYL